MKKRKNIEISGVVVIGILTISFLIPGPVMLGIFTEADESWVPYVPSETAVTIEQRTNNQSTYMDVCIQFNVPCYNVIWGTVTRTGNTFCVDTQITKWTGYCIQIYPAPICHTYSLDMLEKGIYTFVFKAWDLVIKTVTFDVGPINVYTDKELYVVGETAICGIKNNMDMDCGGPCFNLEKNIDGAWVPLSEGWVCTYCLVPPGGTSEINWPLNYGAAEFRLNGTLCDFQGYTYFNVTECCHVYTDKESYIPGETVISGIENIMPKSAECGGGPCMSLEKNVNEQWEQISGPFCTFCIICPGDKCEFPWTLDDRFGPGEYRVNGSFGYIDIRCQRYAYFSVKVPPFEVYVDDDYYDGGHNDGHIWGYDAFDGIQDGIDAIEAGGRMYVYNGTYFENVVIYKPLTLMGEHNGGTIIDAGGYGDIIAVAAPNCTISGFTLTNSGIQDGGHVNCGIYCDDHSPVITNNIINGNNYGIGCWDDSSPVIQRNIITNSTFDGIYVYSCSPLIENNSFIGNGRAGITLRDNATSIIIGNNLGNNTWGINCNYVIGSSNLISNNHISTSQYGVKISGCSNITLQHNNIFNNSDDGINIYESFNTLIENNTIYNTSMDGIYIVHSNNNTILNCEIHGSWDNGINLLRESTHNVISECRCYDNTRNILLEESTHNTIVNCTLYSAYTGIDFGPASYNIVKGCSIHKNNDGIHVSGRNNTILQCDIRDNTDYGVYVQYIESINNIFYHNNFVNNTNQSFDMATNMWDNGYPSSGNYWGDYYGYDAYHGVSQDALGSDGIGDTPYTITGGNNQDKYPLMNYPLQYGVELSCFDMEKSVPPQGNTMYEIVVTNTGNIIDIISIPLPLPCDCGWTESLSTESVELLPNQNTTLFLTVSTVWNFVPIDLWYWMTTITATSQGDPAKSDTLTVNTTIVERWDDTPPQFTTVTCSPPIIPEDTNDNPHLCSGNPVCSEVTVIATTINDTSSIANVTINLSSLGWSPTVPLTRIPGTDIWYILVNATVGTALHDGTRYVPHQLMINASDEYGNWNTATVNITVWRNGDVNGDGVITLYDATYLAKWYFNQQGFEYLPENVADVNGDCIVTLYDATYLAKWHFNQPGFERLR